MRRIGVALATIVVVQLAATAPAFAHATVSPEVATKGSDAVLTFVVPNEEAKATTTQVKCSSRQIIRSPKRSLRQCQAGKRR